MAKKPSAWAPLAAALVASQLCGAAAGPLDADAAYGQDRGQAGASDAGRGHAEASRVAGDIAEAARWDRVTANPGDGTAEEIRVRAVRAADGKSIRVAVALALPVAHEVVWEVLNDFENMPDFVPDIRATRVISAEPGRKRVQIEGAARVLFLEFPIHTTVDAVYHDGSAAIDSVAGNLDIHAVVRVHGEGAYTRGDYQASMMPDFWLPPLIGDYLIGRQVRRQFEGMVAEMHRRADGHQTRGLGGGLRLGGIEPGRVGDGSPPRR